MPTRKAERLALAMLADSVVARFAADWKRCRRSEVPSNRRNNVMEPD
ncbi:MAG: hypothetical protein J7455_20900 [Roseiflexus sp.]|jgi:hypothetical protein|nr:hypothetical protein [Roseiflexus sp.]MBO9391246.1 hypothetical protein [Roseiflexus sp.]